MPLPAVSLMESGEHKSMSRKVYVVNAEKEKNMQDEIYWHLHNFKVSLQEVFQTLIPRYAVVINSYYSDLFLLGDIISSLF